MFYKNLKNISTVIACIFLYLWAAQAHEIDYNTSILGWRDITEKNSRHNIEKARLLKTYIQSLQKEIQDIKNDHYIENIRLNVISDELNKMLGSLNNTLTVHYEKHHAISVYDSIIDKIKTLKNELRSLLKTELQSSAYQLEKNKAEKNKKAQTVSKKFNTFVKIFTPKVRKIENTEKRKLILGSITVINQESSKLSLFWSRKFSSQRQMNDYYSNSLRTIKRELQKIQTIIINY